MTLYKVTYQSMTAFYGPRIIEADNEYDFSEEIDGTIVNVKDLPMLVICEECNLEIEEEAIIKNGRPYHYNCSGIEL